MSKPVELTLLTKPGCHLCDDARAVVTQVCATLDGTLTVQLTEQNILDDAGLARRYAEDIPVLFVNGKRHAVWHVDAERLTTAMLKAAKLTKTGTAAKDRTPAQKELP